MLGFLFSLFAEKGVDYCPPFGNRSGSGGIKLNPIDEGPRCAGNAPCQKYEYMNIRYNSDFSNVAEANASDDDDASDDASDDDDDDDDENENDAFDAPDDDDDDNDDDRFAP